MYLTPPLNGFPLELGTDARGQKTKMTGLPDGQRVFGLDALAKALSAIATATWLAGWVGGCHTPVLYQNGKTYPKTFSTI